MDIKADLNLHRAHMSFCWFCRAAAHLNSIYFTLITQKAHGTEKHILEGGDSSVVEETGVPRGNNGHRTGDPKINEPCH